VKRSGSQLLLALCALFATAAFATTQPIDAVQSAAEAFVRTRLPASQAKQFVSASKLDPRLRVAQCDQPLETFQQSTTTRGERVTVGVRCTSANTWTLYVPVSVEVEIPVLVLRRALARRARVEATDVEPQIRTVQLHRRRRPDSHHRRLLAHMDFRARDASEVGIRDALRPCAPAGVVSASRRERLR
jgi:flagella basal body P-ring formation protein FlgA